ncbi:MAG TPA: peptidyl-prolyl cis-trans isomerase [Phycisphaerae bacterium]|nr:peptidyl-prolyl cis-trans isomerase [Phycisphaerae bacterium]
MRDQLAASEAPSQRADTKAPARQDSKPQASSLKSRPNPVAIVNGEAIDRGELLALLLESRGLAMLQQMILEEVAVQEARRQGLSVKAADIDREYDLTLQANRFNGHDPEKLTPARREKIVDDWCRKNGVTREELAIAMRRQAHLRPLAEGRVSITEAMLKQEYDRVHGEKVVVRHIQLAAPRFYPQFKERLDQGESFEVLVTKFSQNLLSREQAGLLPPISASDDTVPAVFVKAAFAMQPGDVSNVIEAEGSFHILKLERRIPADEAKFEDVRAHLEKNLRARLVAQEMEALAERLLLAAQLQIKDKVLHGQYQKQLGTKEIVGPPLAGP